MEQFIETGYPEEIFTAAKPDSGPVPGRSIVQNSKDLVYLRP